MLPAVYGLAVVQENPVLDAYGSVYPSLTPSASEAMLSC